MSKRAAPKSTTMLKAGWDEESFREEEPTKKRTEKQKTIQPKTRPKANSPKIKAADARPYVFTPTDDGALTTALKEYGRAWSTIQKEYFPQLKAKQIQNHVMNNEKLKVHF